MQGHRTVKADMVFKLLAPTGAVAPIGVELKYESCEPYEVSLTFNAGTSGRVKWSLARDLLADGVLIESGLGDVKISPRSDDPAVIVVLLCSPNGQATFEAEADDLVHFLNQTYDVVPTGEERRWMSVGDALARLLQHDLY